ncbi:hypothetical protein FACS189418_0910 [Clostridia bacterium]|nr:hypothetical protein FACS189418_0910 [Clostridia bacterium]
MNELFFDDFILYQKSEDSIVKEYITKVPNELIEIWRNYGFGSVKSGYLKIINPNEWLDILVESYYVDKESIPIFVTGMGDIIVIDSKGYFMLINYRKRVIKGVGRRFKTFFMMMESESILDEQFCWNPYPDAVERYGKLEYDECFGYEPLLGLGGAEKVENLQKIKIKEHIQIITEFMGPIK